MTVVLQNRLCAAGLLLFLSLPVSAAPGADAARDVGVAEILAPKGVVDSGRLAVPVLSIQNYGTDSAFFPLTVVIGTTYNQTFTYTLAPGVLDTVSFPSWFASPVGVSAVTCYTELTGDENPANDTARGSVTVRSRPTHDAGVAAILAPAGTVDSGAVVLPAAVVTNFGVADTTFPVTMLVGGGYRQTRQDTVAAGRSDTVYFPAWRADTVKDYVVTCFTALVGDQDPANDTLDGSVHVGGAPIHDVGALTILSPSGAIHTGDSVIPTARVANFGTAIERYFDVRLKIGASYNEVATVFADLRPDSSVEVKFPLWVAKAGFWAVTCSTMLVTDNNRINDRAVTTANAYEPARLYLEPDQSDTVPAGTRQAFQFSALLEGDTSLVIELVPSASAPGWSVGLYDALAEDTLEDTDGDGHKDLGRLSPGHQKSFSLVIGTPGGLIGVPDSLGRREFSVTGFAGSDTTVRDVVSLSLTVVSDFAVHNFPNPLFDRTSFLISIPRTGELNLTVYTRSGQRVCRLLNGQAMEEGVHVVRWEATNDRGDAVAPGTYEYLLEYTHDDRTERIRKRLVVGAR